MEKPHVGRLEESDAQWEVGAHEEVLDVIREHNWHGHTNWVCDLGENPVAMQQDDCSEGQGQTTQSERGTIPVEPAEGHAGKDEGGPCRAEGDVEYAYLVPPWWSRREVIDGEVLHDMKGPSGRTADLRKGMSISISKPGDQDKKDGFWPITGRPKTETGERARRRGKTSGMGDTVECGRRCHFIFPWEETRSMVRDTRLGKLVGGSC